VVWPSSVAACSTAQRWRRITEDGPLGGYEDSAYRRGKAELKRLLDEFAAGHPSTALAKIQPSTVVQRDPAGELSRWMLSTLLPKRLIGTRGLPMPLWRGLRTQAVHADDVADAVYTVLTNWATGRSNWWAIRCWARKSWLGSSGAAPGGTPPYARQRCHDRAREKLGWRPRHDAEAAQRELAEGMTERACGASPRSRRTRGTASPGRIMATFPSTRSRRSKMRKETYQRPACSRTVAR
jgi:nucleoside-diphosphate-sugar epimerase